MWTAPSVLRLTAADDLGFEIDEAEVIYWGRCHACVSATDATPLPAGGAPPPASTDTPRSAASTPTRARQWAKPPSRSTRTAITGTQHAGGGQMPGDGRIAEEHVEP